MITRIGDEGDCGQRVAQAIYAMEQLEKSIPIRWRIRGSVCRETVESEINDVHSRRRTGQSIKEGRINCTTCQKVITREVLARGTRTLFSEVDEST